MFQSFEPVADPGFAAKHLPALRAQMKTASLDGFIIPHDDEYQNEYLPAYAERLMWATGFSGSAGAAIVFEESAVIFVDGRYTLQVRWETDEQFFTYENLMETPPAAWLEAHAPRGSRIGYDPMVHTRRGVERLEAAAAKAGFELVAVDGNPVDAAWRDQPARPQTRVYAHDVEFAGKPSAQKRREIGDAIAEQGADAAFIASPTSIAWLFNIRGGDVACSPLPLGRALLKRDGSAVLFLDPRKVDNTLAAHLGEEVALRDESDVDATLAATRDMGLLIDPSSTPARFVQALQDAGARLIEGADPCALPRAEKNSTEVNGARAAHVRDGAAVVRFLHWLDMNAGGGDMDEITAAKKLEEFRRETGELVDISFDTISGSGPNGAVVHYRVTTKTNRNLQPGELFLVDSGAQYKDGTTDITRTVAIGAPSEEMRDRFTRVLRGHIALATARFPSGTTGAQLDTLARRPLWEAGLDYDHGTGHGVGSFLGVHEGPQRIAKTPSNQPMRPGMITSNEPGYYKTDAYGIRIENLVVVQPPAPVADGERPMLSFETLTLAPIDRRLIETRLMSADERRWLDQYHERVRKTLTPLVPDDVKEWLADVTKPL